MFFGRVFRHIYSPFLVLLWIFFFVWLYWLFFFVFGLIGFLIWEKVSNIDSWFFALVLAKYCVIESEVLIFGVKRC